MFKTITFIVFILMFLSGCATLAGFKSVEGKNHYSDWCPMCGKKSFILCDNCWDGKTLDHLNCWKCHGVGLIQCPVCHGESNHFSEWKIPK